MDRSLWIYFPQSQYLSLTHLTHFTQLWLREINSERSIHFPIFSWNQVYNLSYVFLRSGLVDLSEFITLSHNWVSRVSEMSEWDESVRSRLHSTSPPNTISHSTISVLSECEQYQGYNPEKLPPEGLDPPHESLLAGVFRRTRGPDLPTTKRVGPSDPSQC